MRNCFPLYDSHIGDPYHSVKTTVCRSGPFFLGTMPPESLPTKPSGLILPPRLLGKTLLQLQTDGTYTYKIPSYEQKAFSPFKVIH